MTGHDFALLLLPWERSFILPPVFLAVAVIYLRGAAQNRDGIGRRTLFWSGLLLLYVATQTGLDYFAEHLFVVHRLQHVLLHHLGPVLIALSRPGLTFAAGASWRWPKLLRRVAAVLNGPVVAPLLFSALVLLWLVPPVHFAAMLNPFLYRAMNWGMMLNGLMFWSAVVSGHNRLWVRAIMAVAILPAQIAAGLVLVFARNDLYPVYALCGRLAGLTPMADQQLGGAVLWLSGGMMSLLVIFILVASAAPVQHAGSGARPAPSPR